MDKREKKRERERGGLVTWPALMCLTVFTKAPVPLLCEGEREVKV